MAEDPGWGFTGAGGAGSEAHVERTLNVVGSGVQHQTFFKDLIRQALHVFAGSDFAAQPAFVVDTGCGDGTLLRLVYEHVRSHTARGKNLSSFPLTMVGVDLNEESRVRTAVNLSKHAVPHMVLSGDIGRPADIVVALQSKKVDVAKALHIRSFLDHDRPFIEPTRTAREDSTIARYASQQLADFVYLDRAGQRVDALRVFCSLVEHFERWSAVLQGSYGLCLLEAMGLDVETTRQNFNDCVSFHFDLVQSLSRQYVVSPHAFALAAAMAGLLPADVRSVQTYPEHGRYCRVVGQRLVRKPFRIRFAELADLPALLRLEAGAWAEGLRAPAEVLRRRLEVSPTTNFVCEMDGEVVAVLYTQKVDGIGAVDEKSFMELSSTHSESGRVLQLIAICTDAEVRNLGIGSDLRAFALHLARVDPTIDCVIGVTRCRDFKDFRGTMQAYVDKHLARELHDPVLGFHTGFGAKVERLVRNFRPEDSDNNGIGVLIKYEVNEWSRTAGTLAVAEVQEEKGPLPSVDIICNLMADLGYKDARSSLKKGFFDYGMDSLELVRIRNKLSTKLAMELPATLLLDCPTVHDLAEQLDKDRGLDKAQNPEASEADDRRVQWQALKAKDLLELQDRTKKLLALPQYQRRFTELAKKCYPDMCKYILAIDDVMLEVEGNIFFTYGLIEDTNRDTVQKGRAEWMDCLMRYWAEVPELRSRTHDILHLTKQDQLWC